MYAGLVTGIIKLPHIEGGKLGWERVLRLLRRT
jgi:hypothetical protein